MEPGQVAPGRRDDGRELGEQLRPREHEDITPVLRPALHPVREAAVWQLGEPLERERATRAVEGEAKEAFAILGVYPNLGAERKAVERTGAWLAVARLLF